MQKTLKLLNSDFSVLSSIESVPLSASSRLFFTLGKGVGLNSWEAVAKPSRLGEVSLLFSKNCLGVADVWGEYDLKTSGFPAWKFRFSAAGEDSCTINLFMISNTEF